MKTKTLLGALLAAVVAFSIVRAADITPADSSTVVLTKEETTGPKPKRLRSFLPAEAHGSRRAS